MRCGDAGSATTPLASTAVAVVLNLALVFGAAVVRPEGWSGGTRWFAILMSAAAFALFYRYKVDGLWVVHGGGAPGSAARLLIAR